MRTSEVGEESIHMKSIIHVSNEIVYRVSVGFSRIIVGLNKVSSIPVNLISTSLILTNGEPIVFPLF